MLPTLSCEHCDAPLNTADELSTKLCKACLVLLSSKDSFAGSCWKCGRITMIQMIPKQLKGVLTEKYLFTKECSHCTGVVSDDMAWITMKTYQPDSRLIVSEDGELLKVTSSHVKTKDR